MSIINLKFSAASASGEEIERTKQLEMAHCAHHDRGVGAVRFVLGCVIKRQINATRDRLQCLPRYGYMDRTDDDDDQPSGE